MSRETELKDDFSSILLKWEKALTATESDLSRDAAILRFELAFEVGWKLIKKMARKEGYDVKSPRQAFRQAFSMGWIADEVIWSDILEARNKVTHVYRETYAKTLYKELESYYDAFKKLEAALKNAG